MACGRSRPGARGLSEVVGTIERMFDTNTPSDHRGEADGPAYHPDVTTTAGEVAAEIRRAAPTARSSRWKLHKLLYFCQGHHLAQLGQPLFSETLVAWDRGPVVSSLWGAENHGPPVEAHPRSTLDEAALNTIAYVLGRYGRLSGRDLVNLTHSQTPWQEADAERQSRGDRSAPIAHETLRTYFSEPIDGDADAEYREPQVDDATVATFLNDARSHSGRSTTPDDYARLRALAAAR